MQLGMNLTGINVNSNDQHSPDLISTYAGNLFLDFNTVQTTTTAAHTLGSGVFQLATVAGFGPFGATLPGAVVGVTAQVTDINGTGHIIKVNGYVVVGTNLLIATSFPGLADQNVASGALVDNINQGNCSWNNPNGLAIEPVYVNGSSRNTGYPNGLNSGQQIFLSASPSVPTTGPTGGYAGFPAGTYTLQANGSGTLIVELNYQDGTHTNTSCTVTNGVPSPSTFTATKPVADVTLDLTASTNGNPLCDIALIMPDDSGGTSFATTYAAHRSNPNYYLYHPDFLTSLKNFSPLRFMDWGSTNNSQVQNWTDRNLPQWSPGYNQTKPFPYEWECQLCNSTGADGWWCIPHQASDSYVQSLAQLLLANLASTAKVYVEWSNETWNGQFQQPTHCLVQGIANFHSAIVQSITYSGGVCTATMPGHGFTASESVQIANATDPGYNGVFAISNVTANTFQYTPATAPGSSPAVAKQWHALMALAASSALASTVSSMTWAWTASSAVVTVNTTSSHGLSSGDAVLIANSSDDGFNGVFCNVGIGSSTQFNFRFDQCGNTRTLPAASSISTTASPVSGQSIKVYRVAGNNNNTGGVLNNTTAANQYAGLRSAQIHNLFCSAWTGAGGNVARIVRVLGIQSSSSVGPSTTWSIRYTQYQASIGTPPACPLVLSFAPYYFTEGYTDANLIGAQQSISSITYSAGTCTVTTNNNHGYTGTLAVQIVNARQAGYNGVFQATVTGLKTFTYTPVVAPSASPATPFGLMGFLAVTTGSNFREIVAMSLTSGVVTCTSYGHGFTTGQTPRVGGISYPMDYNATVTITVTDPNTFTFPLTTTTTQPSFFGNFNPFAYDYGQVALVLAAATAYINDQTSGVYAQCQASKTDATAAGVGMVCYEAGQSLIPSLSNQNWPALSDLYSTVNRDSGMIAQTIAYFQLLQSFGINPPVAFASFTADTKSGNWGMAEWPQQPAAFAPKRTALTQLVQTVFVNGLAVKWTEPARPTIFSTRR